MSTETNNPSKPNTPNDEERFRYAPHLIEWVVRPRPVEEEKFKLLHLDTCPARWAGDATCICECLRLLRGR